MRTKSRTFIYAVAVSAAAILSLLGGWMLTPSINEPYQDAVDTVTPGPIEIHALFQKGLSQMLAKEYLRASETWSALLALQPDMPEAHVNLGFSLMELGQHHRACEHFDLATRVNSYQLNAYYGLATCLEAQGDIPGALGAMRAFVHLTPEDDPFLRKANAAIWEWQSIIDTRNKERNPDEGAERQAAAD